LVDRYFHVFRLAIHEKKQKSAENNLFKINVLLCIHEFTALYVNLTMIAIEHKHDINFFIYFAVTGATPGVSVALTWCRYVLLSQAYWRFAHNPAFLDQPVAFSYWL
jgi:hypothetical protein